jgi:hypothetical protein
VGEVTSAARLAGRTALLARVSWDSREGPFETAPGGALTLLRMAKPWGSGQASAR